MAYKPQKRTAGQGSARPQRLFQILSILYEERFANDATFNPEGWMTSGQIAREMRLTTSPHFRELLDQLYGDGCIEVRARYWRKNMQVFDWRIKDDTRWCAAWRSAFDAWLDPQAVLA